MFIHDFEPSSFVVLGHGPQGNVWAKILSELGLLDDHLHSSKLSSYKTLPEDRYYVILGPDLYHGQIIQTLQERVKKIRAYVFAHGYSYAFKLFETSVPCWLVAPKAIAPKLLEAYQGKNSVSVVVDADPVDELEKAKKLAKVLGASNLLEASFKQEAYCDLFTEQTLLCFGLPYLLQKSHDFLVSKGIPAGLAATELMEESILMLEMIKQRGISGMLSDISTTAKVGAAKGTVDDFPRVWDWISDGSFHKYLIEEVNSGNRKAESFIADFKNSSFDRTREDSL